MLQNRAAQAQKQPVPMPTTYEALRHDLIASGRAYDFDMIDRAYQLASAAACHPVPPQRRTVYLPPNQRGTAAGGTWHG